MARTYCAFLFLFCLFNAPVGLQAQQPDLDSLLRVWNDPSRSDSIRVDAYSGYVFYGFVASKPDTVVVLVDALHRYAKEHAYPIATVQGYTIAGLTAQYQGDFTQALDHFQKGLATSEAIGYERGLAIGYVNVGTAYTNLGNYPLSLEYYKKSLVIMERTGKMEDATDVMNNIGVIYAEQGNNPMALEYYQKGLALNERSGNKKGLAVALHNIGVVHQAQRNYAQALANYQKARVLNEELGNGERLMGNLNNIGTIHQVQGDRASALEYFQQAAELSEELGMKSALAENLINIGSIHTEQGDLGRALEYLRRSEAVHEEIGYKLGLSVSLNSIGLVHLKQGELPLAVADCQKSRALAEEIGSVDRQKEACACLYEAYKAMGDKGNALRYYEQMVAHRDSMFNEESTKKLTQLEMQYDFDKQQAATAAEQEQKDALAAQELKRQKLVRNGIGGGLAFALLFLGVVWRQRNKIAKARKRSDELLLNILPEEVAEELKAKGSAEAVHIDQVTVLFTDFKGFTAMSETMSPQELVRDLNECFSAFDRITEKYGIEKIKTIGDAYMAAGGLPTPNTTHATDVIQAALEMRDLIAEGKARKIAAGLPFFEVRVGIHSGPVVAGIVGVKKFQYDIWGDTVNTASRMESSGEVGQVNISEATYALVKREPGLTFTPRGKVQAKGKGEMEMYFVSTKR